VSTKTKNNKIKTKTAADKLSQAGSQLGVMLMTAAVTLGMLELPEHPNSRVVVPGQPAFVFAENSGDANPNNPIRREREEETGPHYISYSVAERTPSRTGKV
jgi:hypothetical protein